MIVAVYLSYLLVRPIGKEQNRGHFLRTQCAQEVTSVLLFYLFQLGLASVY